MPVCDLHGYGTHRQSPSPSRARQTRQRNAGVSLSVGVTVSRSRRVSVLLLALSPTCVRIRRVVDRARESRRPRSGKPLGSLSEPEVTAHESLVQAEGGGSARRVHTVHPHNEILHSASAHSEIFASGAKSRAHAHTRRSGHASASHSCFPHRTVEPHIPRT